MVTSIFDTDAQPTTQPKPQPVTLRTPHDAALVVRALEERVESLKDLAKKNEKGGYPRQAREQQGDAAALEVYVLPQFKTQQELPLATPEQVRYGIANAIRESIRNKLVVRVMAKATPDDEEKSVGYRETELSDALAIRFERFATAIAEAAYEAGVAARESAPEVIALRSIDALYES